MVPQMRSFFSSIILQVVLGTTDVSVELIRDIEVWSQGLLAPPLTFIPWSTAGKAIRARGRIVAQLKETMKTNTTSKGLLSTLKDARDPETGEFLSEDVTLDNLFTLVFAGLDTTSSAAVSIWVVLSQHPNLKEQLMKGDGNEIEVFVQGILEAFPPLPFNMRKRRKTWTLAVTEFQPSGRSLMVLQQPWMDVRFHSR